jgi:hypothetical protein
VKRAAGEGGEYVKILVDASMLDDGVDPHACYSGDAARETVVTPRTNQTRLCTADDELTEAKRRYISDVLVANAVRAIESTLHRWPGPQVVTFTRDGYSDDRDSSCDFTGYAPVPVPSEMVENGVDGYDVVVFLTARPSPVSTTLAYAGDCRFDADTGRPTAGRINVAPAGVDGTFVWADQGIVLHELLHLLGFSKSAWVRYRAREDDGTTFSGPGQFASLTSLITNEDLEGGQAFQVLQSPGVRSRVRDHFGCQTVAGAPLENYNGGSSHWDKRAFNNELMTATRSPNPVLSPLSLAVLVDAGWYPSFDEERTTALEWGRDAGCSFLTEACVADAGWPADLLCTSREVQRCSWDGLAPATCGIVDYSFALPGPFRYFTESQRRGGTSELADYCPFDEYQEAQLCSRASLARAMPWKSEETERAARVDTAFDEYQCPTCRCLNLDNDNFGAGCFELRCNSAGTALDVYASNAWRPCTPGAVMSLGLDTSLTCPSADRVTRICADLALDGANVDATDGPIETGVGGLPDSSLAVLLTTELRGTCVSASALAADPPDAFCRCVLDQGGATVYPDLLCSTACTCDEKACQRTECGVTVPLILIGLAILLLPVAIYGCVIMRRRRQEAEDEELRAELVQLATAQQASQQSSKESMDARRSMALDRASAADAATSDATSRSTGSLTTDAESSSRGPVRPAGAPPPGNLSRVSESATSNSRMSAVM